MEVKGREVRVGWGNRLCKHNYACMRGLDKSSMGSNDNEIRQEDKNRQRTVRFQYFSKSSFVENCSPSEYSKGVLPMRISKNVIPNDHTSDLRVSCGRPRALSGERYWIFNNKGR